MHIAHEVLEMQRSQLASVQSVEPEHLPVLSTSLELAHTRQVLVAVLETYSQFEIAMAVHALPAVFT